MSEKHSPETNPIQLTNDAGETVAFQYEEVKPKKSRWLRNTMITILVLLLAVAGVAGAYVWQLNNSFSQAERVPDVEIFPEVENRVENVEGPRNILLLGSDTRGEVGDDIEDISGQRSDTIMVMHIPGDSSSVQVMSIMRDNWVQLPDQRYAKINAALAVGGIPMLVETVEGLIQDQIDHVAIIDFEGFKGLTDALGGVTINNPIEFSSRGSYFPAGEITLQGEDALNYVRDRYSFSDGDYQRVRNQQTFIKGVMGELLSKDTLTNPSRIQDVVKSLSPFLLTDSGLNGSYLVSEGLALRNVRPGDMRFFTSPTLGTGTSNDGQSIVLPDWDAWEKLGEHFKNDTVAEWDPDTLQ